MDMIPNKNSTTILHGNQNLTDGLWDMELKLPSHFANLLTINNAQKLNVVFSKSTSLTELIKFYQGCCFSPSKATLLRAAQNGNFITWPVSSPHNIIKYYKMTMAMAKGHLNQERKNLQSTKQLFPSNEEAFLIENDHFPCVQLHERVPKYEYMAILLPFTTKGTGYTDLTDRFPYKSA
jgi:hypothetical protein